VTTESLSYCRICAASCGIVVTLEDDSETGQVLTVRGDPEHPVSKGYTCPKGRALPALHHHADRIDRPRVDGSERDWGATLDDLAERLASVISAHGPDAVAGYFGTGLAYDTAGWIAANAWLAAIGSRRLFTPATVDNAPVLCSAEMVAGHPQANPIWDVERAKLVLILGSNPVVSHGYGTAMPDPITHLRSARQHGASVWVLDPRRTETAAIADRHLATRPGSDAILLAWLVRERLAAPLSTEATTATDAADRAALAAALAPFSVERAAAAADVDHADLLALRDAVLAADGALAAWCGTGITMSRDGLVAEWLRWVLLVLTGSLDTPDGMKLHRGQLFPLRKMKNVEASVKPRGRQERTLQDPATSRPELRHWIGQDACVALVDDIDAGNIRALVVAGASPITAFPNPAATRAALGRLDALAVVDVNETELTRAASHVLAATDQLERADIPMHEHVALRGGTCYSAAVVAPRHERRPVWWQFAQLARRMTGNDLFGADPDELDDNAVLAMLAARSPTPFDTIRESGPRGVTVTPDVGWVRDALLDGGPWRIAPAALVERLGTLEDPDDSLVMVPRRRMRANNSVPSPNPDAAEREPLVLVHPDDAADASVADGALVTLTSRHGDVTARIRCDANLKPGVVAMSHGDAVSTSGALVSASDDVDELTGMPRASGVAISIAPPEARR
jgi:anaerobic selenocysteine-containing dehydrogenase